MDVVNVTKYSGELEAFDVNKLIGSLGRSQEDESLVQDIAQEIQGKIEEGMTTKKIYQMAFRMLKDRKRTSASRYKLKKALMELGPSGFPFEKIVGRLLAHEGFDTKVGVIVQGNCVQHEIDVIAQKDKKHYMIECKYHSDQGWFCNVKIPLYIRSRFLDVEKHLEKQTRHQNISHQGGVYTNTRFTTDAIKYGTCVGLMLTSWDYPKGNGLKERIDRSGLHPLTSLTTLTKAEKSKLLDKGIVLCQEINETPSLLQQMGITEQRQKNILKDSEELCRTY